MTLVTSITAKGEEVEVCTSSARQGDLLADRPLYLTATEDEVVEAKDPRRAFLLVAEGLTVPKEQAERLGLRLEQGRLAWGNPVRESGERAEESPAASPSYPPTAKRKPGRPKKEVTDG